MKIDKYLYEIIDDYKNSDSDMEKNDIFKAFCQSVWSSSNKRKTYTKSFKYKVKKDLLDTDIGQVFNTWSEVEYKKYKSISKETDWCSLIRQKINNLYTRYFDKEIILAKDYVNLLKTPKCLYYRWLDGTDITCDELTSSINNAMDDAQKLKITYQNRKIELSWNDYKKLIEGIFQKTFNNCKLIEDYENRNKCSNIYDFINEDNFYIKYFCTYLEYEMRQWQKKYYGVRNHQKYKRCKSCGSLIENTGNKRMYCIKCAGKRKKESNIKSDKKYRTKQRENRKL